MTPEHSNPIWKLTFTGDRAGFPLLWLHGFMGSSADWRQLVDTHFLDYYNILADIPGHGKASFSERENYPALVNDLFLQLASDGIKQFIPIGYSMGGRIALHLEKRYPCHIPALIGLSTGPGLKTEEERRQRRQADAELMQKLDTLGLREFLIQWYQSPLFQSIQKNRQLLNLLMASRLQNNSLQLRRAIEIFGNGVMPSLWERLPELEKPVLLLCGALDRKYCRINQEMSGLIQVCEHHIIEGGDHAFYQEKPLETALLIRHFLRPIIEGV